MEQFNNLIEFRQAIVTLPSRRFGRNLRTGVRRNKLLTLSPATF